jgi:predicted RNA-binding Zn ribbon-like protein
VAEPRTIPENVELVRDFVNTYDVEDDVDELATAQALGGWLAAHGLLRARGEATESQRRRAIDLREALRLLLFANNGADVNVRPAAEALDRAAQRSAVELRFRADGHVHLQCSASGVDGALGRILAAVASSMAEGTWPRLKACRAADCQWAFFDNAKNQSRTWCSMSVCGNRQKARAYRERHSV